MKIKNFKSFHLDRFDDEDIYVENVNTLFIRVSSSDNLGSLACINVNAIHIIIDDVESNEFAKFDKVRLTNVGCVFYKLFAACDNVVLSNVHNVLYNKFDTINIKEINREGVKNIIPYTLEENATYGGYYYKYESTEFLKELKENPIVSNDNSENAYIEDILGEYRYVVFDHCSTLIISDCTFIYLIGKTLKNISHVIMEKVEPQTTVFIQNDKGLPTDSIVFYEGEEKSINKVTYDTDGNKHDLTITYQP